ncbi:hypothetical protein [Halococcus sp. IIIV-5B]|uniref:hypothetical protein n=1 Tax=Halococcus sp. IIIV-5B TaxID=2321230 RepID=UPI000E7261A9|nr:hypothetical protein [Halococcus sp. IIIV-5B]RJT07148.1 hypothetical protein D3261_03845 [Halococcus sp. IIIV-5B]
MSWERRLPPLAEDALDILREAAKDETGSNETGEQDFSNADFTKDSATAVLVADEEFTEADAEHALELLESRGHIYYVDDKVYLTPTDD